MTVVDLSRKPLTLRMGIPAERLGFVANGVALWGVVLACALVDVVLLPFSGFHLSAEGLFKINPIIGLVLVPIAAFYTFVRYDQMIASVTNAFAVLIVATPLLCLFTYVAASLGQGLPLRDETLATFDATIGFDWRAMLAWADRHPALAGIGALAYESLAIQGAVMAIVLTVVAQAERLQVSIYAYMISAAICGALSAVVPALGAYGFYHIEPSQFSHIELVSRDLHLADILALRSGSFSVYVIDAAKGIITFPSFHAALGILFAWSFWRVAWLRWPSLALNTALVAATPLHGGHYVADVLAGFGVAWSSIIVAGRLHGVIGLRRTAVPDGKQIAMLSFH